jgi:quercetin dioxygenase-like cupin family protein
MKRQEKNSMGKQKLLCQKSKANLYIWGLCCLILISLAVPASGYDSGVTVHILSKTRTTSSGQPLKYMKTDNPEVTAAIVEIAPGADTGWHLHRVPVYAYVLEGTIKITMDGGAEATFYKGQAIIEAMNTAHVGINMSKDTVRLMVFYTGDIDTPIAVKVQR